MDDSTSEGRIIIALKNHFKNEGVRYRDVAARMNVSEATVKRYFRGRGISLSVLCKLADIANLNLQSLGALAEQNEAKSRKITKAQREALAKDHFILMVFSLLSQGWTPVQIAKEFEITQELDSALARLQSLGLVRQLAHGVKVLATAERDRPQDRITQVGRRHFAQIFAAEVDVNDQKGEWRTASVRLSRSSATRLREMVARFLEEARTLSIAEIDLPRSEVQWYRIFVFAQPADRRRILPVTKDA